jgi:hypothetical protein
VAEELPFPISTRPWSELPEGERSFFSFGDDYLPLHPSHAAQLRLLVPTDAQRLATWAFSALPPGWPEQADQRFEHEEQLGVGECWQDAGRRAEVRQWLFNLGVPFRRTVYLLYERDVVVQTTWRMVVRYWDAFAWSVGYAMVAVDHSLQWACCFHHEDVIVFGSHARAVNAQREPAAPDNEAAPSPSVYNATQRPRI